MKSPTDLQTRAKNLANSAALTAQEAARCFEQGYYYQAQVLINQSFEYCQQCKIYSAQLLRQ